MPAPLPNLLAGQSALAWLSSHANHVSCGKGQTTNVRARVLVGEGWLLVTHQTRASGGYASCVACPVCGQEYRIKSSKRQIAHKISHWREEEACKFVQLPSAWGERS